MLWNQGGGGSGAGVVAKTCTSGDFFSAVDGSGNFTCATPAGSGDVTAVGDCASGACFSGTTGSILTGATGTSLVFNTDNNIYLSFDTDNNATSTGVVIGSNASGASATPYVVISDAATPNVTLRNATRLRFNDTSDDTNYVELVGPSGISSNFTFTLPSDDGTSNQFLQTNGSGALTWATALTAEVDGSTTNEIQNLFETINAPSGTDPVADGATDTLNFAASGIVTVTGDSSTDTITIAATEVDGSTTNEIEVVDEAYSSANFNGGTTSAVSQDDFYDLIHAGDADDDGKPDVLDTTTNGFVKTTGGTGAITIDTSTYLTAEVDGSTTNEIEVVDEAYSSANFNGGTTSAVSQDDFYDLMHIGDADDDGKPDTLDTAVTAGTITASLTGAASLNTLLAGRSGTGNDTIISTDGTGTIYGSGATTNDLTLRANDDDTTTGEINLDAPRLDLYPSFPASTSSNFTLLDFDNTATLNAASGQVFNGIKIAPAFTISGTVPLIRGFWFGGTITNTDTSDPLAVYQVNGFLNNPTLTSATANSGSLYQDAFVDQTIMEYTGTGTIDTTSNPWAPISFLSSPKLKTTSTGDVTIGAVYGLHFKPGWFTATGSSGNVDNLEAVNAIPPATAVGESVSAAGSTITHYSVAHGYFNASLPANLSITNAYGLRLTDWDKATNNYSLYTTSNAQLVNGGKADIGDAVGHVTGGSSINIIDIAPSSNVTGTNSALAGVSVTPTSTMNPTTLATQNYMRGFYFGPSATLNSTGILGQPNISALVAGGTVTTGDTNTLGFGNLLYNGTTYTTATAGASPISTSAAIYNAPAHTVTSSSGTSAITGASGLTHVPTFTLNSGGGATASMTVTDDDAVVARSSYTKTAGTALTVTTRRGLRYLEAATSGSPTITTQVGVDIEALSAATTNIGIRNADTTVYTPTTQTVVASDTIAPTASLVCLNAAANRDMTSTPHISDGVDGQVLTVMNCDTGTDTIELNDQANVASSGLQLAGNSDVILSPGQSITLVYTSAGGASDWFEIARTAPFQNIKSLVIKSDVTQVNYFCGPGFDCNATETNVDVQIPTDITVVGLSCEQKDDTTCTVAYTVRDDASNTSATCTTTNADVCNWNGSVAIAANSMIDIQLTSWTSCSNNSDIECAITYKVP